MAHIQGISRTQFKMLSLEDTIALENPVRFIDAFSEQVDLTKLGFVVQLQKEEGRPGYETSLFLKIYLYGYLNGIRSSRKLERECVRNMELQWLTCGLCPSYHSISDFRKRNPKALRNVFKLFVSFLKNEELITGETIAIDGTKSRAHNSKKNNYNQKKIDRHLQYIEEKSEKYMQELEQNDTQEDELKVTNIKEKLARLSANKLHYKLLEKELGSSGEPQISTTDKDARALLVQGQVVEVSYNLQAAVDAKHSLVVATHTINRNDRNALTTIALEAKENLGASTFSVLADKGYHNGREIQKCEDHSITTIVAQQAIVNSNDKGTTPAYLVTRFIYNKQADTYTCPQGETLTTRGTWHTKKRDEKNVYEYKKYRTPKCASCSVKHLCTGRQKGGREIERSEYADAVEANNERYRENQTLYRKRQEINEHIFGTIKRQWNYYYTNLKGLEKVNGEHSLIMLVYNIKRTINIIGVTDLIARLKKWQPDYKRIVQLCLKQACFEAFYGHYDFEKKVAA